MKSKREKRQLEFHDIRQPTEIQTKKCRISYMDEEKKIIFSINSYKNRRLRIQESLKLNENFDYLKQDENDQEYDQIDEDVEIVEENLKNESSSVSSVENIKNDQFLRYYDSNFLCPYCFRQKNKLFDVCLNCQTLCYYCLSEHHVRSSCKNISCFYCEQKHLRHKCRKYEDYKQRRTAQGLFSTVEKDFQFVQFRHKREMGKAVCLLCGQNGHFSCKLKTEDIDMQTDFESVAIFDKDDRQKDEQKFFENYKNFDFIFVEYFQYGRIDRDHLNFNMSKFVVLELPFYVIKCLKKNQGQFLRSFKNKYLQQNQTQNYENKTQKEIQDNYELKKNKNLENKKNKQRKNKKKTQYNENEEQIDKQQNSHKFNIQNIEQNIENQSYQKNQKFSRNKKSNKNFQEKSIKDFNPNLNTADLESFQNQKQINDNMNFNQEIVFVNKNQKQNQRKRQRKNNKQQKYQQTKIFQNQKEDQNQQKKFQKQNQNFQQQQSNNKNVYYDYVNQKNEQTIQQTFTQQSSLIFQSDYNPYKQDNGYYQQSYQQRNQEEFDQKPKTNQKKPGCLKCGDKRSCQLCDINLGMTLEYGECVQKSTENCLYYGQNSNCLQCLHNYYLDSATNKCVKVETLIDNCVYYQSDTACLLCDKNFYVSSGQCLQVISDIHNCKIQENANHCLQCEIGYVLTSDHKKCIQLATKQEIRNCLTYSSIVCTECDEDFILNKNLYIKNIFAEFDLTKIENFNSHISFFNNKMVNNVCESIVVDNCVEYKDAYTCQRCQNGYFLDKGQCINNPFPQIENCFVYTRHDECSQCMPNFYLQSKEKCTAVSENSVVENCLYNTASECKKCIQNYYLKSNKCEPNPTIENCEIFSTSEPECLQCSFGFVLTGDKKKCLTEVPNCTQYEPSTEADTILLCSGCTNGTYLTTDKQCTQGSVANCSEYDGLGQTCLKCVNSFYLEGTECKAHDVLPFCSLYSNTVKNECIGCEANHFLFKIDTGCYKADEILNCLDHKSKTECERCVLGFYLDQNQCKQIPAEENCLKRNDDDATKCDLCKMDYYINSQQKCELIYDFQKNTCLNAEGDLNGYYKCDTCNPLYFFKELETDSAICIKSERITQDIAIANCTAYLYDSDSNSYKCKNCGENFITLTSSNDMLACQSECTESDQTIMEARFIANVIILGDANYRKVEMSFVDFRGKTCKKEDSDTNCQQTVIANDTDEVCAEIKSNPTKLPYLRRSIEESSAFGYQNNFKTVTKNGYSIPTFDFHSSIADASYPTYGDSANFCESYYRGAQNIATSNYAFYCDSCQFGKTGNISTTTSAYVRCDVDIAGCSSKQYGGLMYNLQSFNTHSVNSQIFRCHECANSDEIPFIHLPLNSTAKWASSNQYKAYGLDLASSKPSSSGNKNGDLISCRQPTASGLVIPEQDFTREFPQNCALGLYNIDIEKSYRLETNSKQLSVYCLECAPGFKKKLNADFQISSCEPIEHCQQNSIEELFNACGQCEYGYTWSYDNSSFVINFDECVQNPVKNCLVTDGQKCIYCKKGFYLENDLKCNKITVDKCQVFNYNKYKFYVIEDSDNNPLQVQTPFGLYLSLNQDGCQQCNQNYTLLTTPDLQLKQCVSSFNVENDDLLDSSYLINNCEIYKGYYKGCQRCKVGYLPNEDRSKCLSNINFPHCLKMKEINQQNSCIECEDDFYLVEGSCVKGNIEHCMRYEEDKIPAECIECASGMRPSRDNLSCINGHMEFCDIYKDEYETSCSQCINNQTPLIQLNNGVNRCLQNLENQFCQDLDVLSAQNNLFKCSKCKTNYFKSNSSEFINPVSFCIPFFKIENCAVYDTTSKYLLNSSKCLKCEDGFYVSQYGLSCLERTLLISNCVEYQPNSVKCSQCSEGYFLGADEQECIEYPKGIRHCIQYISLTECKTCLEDYYLKESKCVLVPDESKIENCIEYNAELLCTRCNTNYLQNSEGKCVIPEAQNCETFESLTQCKSCKDGMVFETVEDTGLRNCRSMDIFKCEKINPETQKCEQCGEGYYIQENGTCGLAQSINFCLEYLSENLCQKCEIGFYLSESKKSCLRSNSIVKIPENCRLSFYEEVPQCIHCQYGFYFHEGECLSCKSSSCAICEPSDPEICFLCKSGYYQNDFLGKCVPNPQEQVEVVQSELIGKVYAMLVLFALFWT